MRQSALVVLCLTLLPAPSSAAIGDESMGINTHIPPNAVVDLVAGAGLKWARMDSVWGAHSNPCSASLGYIGALEQAVDYARTKGVSVYLGFGSTPKCASTANKDGKANDNDVPDAALYAQFVRKSVAHYRGKGVRHFGLWNEPNLSSFWEGDVNSFFSNVVKPGIQAVKDGCKDAGQSDCLAMGPELAHVGDYDVFMEALIKLMKAASLKYDLFTHHIYQSYDTQIWGGDSFLNALDNRRFFFTRRSLVDVLKDTGYAPGGTPSIEVWLTETGHQCQPVKDSKQMAYQSTTYQFVISEQLKRPWWTNTFFYEIADSFDQLDGFGITRLESGNYFLKPAYTDLKARVAAEPTLSGGTKTACSDGKDNDSDGLIDLADPGCTDGSDGDEFNAPVMKPTIVALPASSVTIDGDLGDWSKAQWASITSPDNYVSDSFPPGDAADLSAQIAAMWEAGNLYLAVKVTDQNHTNSEAADLIWKGDSVQVAFDVGRTGGTQYDSNDDYEMGWALVGSKTLAYRWQAPTIATPPFATTASVKRQGTTTAYEIKIPADNLKLTALDGTMTLGFSLLVNDNDGSGRRGFIEWATGIGRTKNPSQFGELQLRSSGTAGDAAVARDMAVAPGSDLVVAPGSDLVVAPGSDLIAPDEDAGVSDSDGGASTKDASVKRDGNLVFEDMPDSPVDDGGCRVASRGPLPWTLLFLLLAPLALRRRRG